LTRVRRILFEMQGEVRGWFVAAWASVLLLVALAIGIAPSSIAVWDSTLTGVPEPEGWRTWPLADTATVQHGVCAGGRWFGGGSKACVPEAAGGTETWIRRAPDGRTFVVAGVATHDQAPEERFVWAFERTAGRRLSFTSRGAAACIATLAGGLALLALGLGVARRRLRRAAIAASAIWGAYSTLASASAAYRSPAATKAPASVQICLEEGARGAKRALGTAFVALVVVFGVFVVSVGYVVLDAWFHCVL